MAAAAAAVLASFGPGMTIFDATDEEGAGDGDTGGVSFVG